MKIKIIKRDNTKQKFNPDAIYNAVLSAALEVKITEETINPQAVAKLVTDKVTYKVIKKKVTTVEEIQEAVERVLMGSKYKSIATAYISYRHDRDQMREQVSEWAELGLRFLNSEDTDSQRENSNVPRDSVTTQIEMIKRGYCKKIATDHIIPKRFLKLHNKGQLHIHDIDAVASRVHNCMLFNYPYMFNHGFQLGNKRIEKPTTILTAMNVLVQMVQVQSNLQFGGLTLADLDIHMADFVKGSYDKYLQDTLLDFEDDTVCERYEKIALRKVEREVYRSSKLLSYQLNTLQVRGESSPFVTITYGKATSWEGKLVQRMILKERMDEFLLSGVQEFPKHQFIVREGVNFNPEDPNYDIFQQAIKTSAKTCYPDYIYPDNQVKLTGGEASYMGCRALLPVYKDQPDLYMGRANVGVCSVNLPHIALEVAGNREDFFKVLEERVNIAMDVMEWRYERLTSLKAKEAAFSYIGGAFGMKFDPEESIEKAYANGRGSLSVGYIGLHEVCLAIVGEEPYYSEEAKQLQKDVLTYINNLIQVRKEETKLGFGLYATPSESLTDRLCGLDLETFGSVEGITDKGFYVNSFHVNTETTLTPFEKIDIEAELQALSLAGHISYVESHNLSDNLEAYETLLRYGYKKGLMHQAVNAPWDFCKTCHWTGELTLAEDIDFQYSCPNCKECDKDKVVVTRRLCGYLTTVNKRAPVIGRMKEMVSRVKHDITGKETVYLK
jgi:ribonucleoside-triphosphate reductase